MTASWLAIALFGYVLLGVVAVLDKFILARKLPHPAAYAFYIGIADIFVLALVPFGFSWPAPGTVLLALASGAVFILALIFFFRGVIAFEASRVVPVFGALTPVFLFVLSFFHDALRLNEFQTIAFVLLVGGGFLISYRRAEQGNMRLFMLAAAAAFFAALSYFLAKIVYTESDFISGFVLGRVGTFAAACAMLLVPALRSAIFSATKAAARQSIILVGANKALASLAFIAIHYAIFLGNVTLVQALAGVQYVFLVLILTLISWKLPAIFHERAGFGAIARKTFATLVIGFGIFILAFSEKPRDLATGVVAYGVTFSEKYAKDMNLDWRAAYLATLDDLGVRHVRIPAYWDLAEQNRDEFQYDDLDWQIEEAEKRNAIIVLSVGYRVPRWPECHIPEWAKNLPREEFEREALAYVRTTVERYQRYYSIKYWQVENEPFLSFGECPSFHAEFLDEEIASVRSLDPRPIIISDSGELSFWIQAANRADVFGTTMYRTIWSPKVGGYFDYPLPPEFFHLKANFVKAFGTMRRAIVIELQAEPWGPNLAYTLAPEEVIKSFSPEKFRDNIRYAEEVGFPEVYLWGVEWWYYQKEHGDARYWDYAREVFSGSN
ncbi:MAG: DMT family transporter [Patescibacteria group bacterium]